jgi:hypothetical protein
MTHKKYIKIKGKTYGPYYYESYREDGKVKKRYVKNLPETLWSKSSFFSQKKLFIIIPLILILSLGILFLFNFEKGITGEVILSLDDNVGKIGEIMGGKLNLHFREGEFFPADSVVVLNLGDQIIRKKLSEILGEAKEGDYYVRNKNISGKGLGYGVEGEIISYPEVSFELEIYSEIGGGGDVVEEVPYEEEKEEPIEEEKEEPIEEETEEEIGEEVDNEEESEVEESTNEDLRETESEGGSGSDSSSGDSSSDAGQDRGAGQERAEEARPESPGRSSESSGGGSESPGKSAEAPGRSLITGDVVRDSGRIIKGTVSAEEPFEFELKENEKARIVSGSVNFNGEVLEDNEISLQERDGKVIVTSDYFIKVTGFGFEFLSEKEVEFGVDISEFNLIREGGLLKVEFSFEETMIDEFSKEIKIEKEVIDENNETEEIPIEIPEMNETIDEEIEFGLIKEIPDLRIRINENLSLDLENYFIGVENYSFEIVENISFIIEESILIFIPDGNFSGERESFVVGHRFLNETEESFESNKFKIFISDENVSIVTSQHRAVIGQPVKWKKVVEKPEEENIGVELPKGSRNITVRSGKVEEEESLEEVESGRITITGAVISEEGVGTRFLEFLKRFRLTGWVVSNIIEDEEFVFVEVEDNSTLIEIEYETEAPQAREELIENGKRVIISGPSELGYTDILAYSELEEELQFSNSSRGKVRLYWIGNESREVVNFDVYDLSEDGMIDYIEWNVPHLSEQVYELIIEIVFAEHLDENRTFVKDVYDLVSEKDDIWFVVPDGDYIRVGFEQNLSSARDITLYARAYCNETILINGTEVPCEIYEKKMELDKLRRENG